MPPKTVTDFENYGEILKKKKIEENFQNIPEKKTSKIQLCKFFDKFSRITYGDFE